MASQRHTSADAEKVGRYELVERLGAGGMSEIFRAKARGPGGYERDLVIKRILLEYARDPEFVRMFVDEAKILGMLHHPNIVEIYDFGEHDGRHFLALQYVDGPSVSRITAALRRTDKPMPPAIAAHIAREVCNGLGAVHELRDPRTGALLNVIHRDVTPSNIIVTMSGLVKLLDFGVAKIGATITRLGGVKGKPAYLAPEQLQEKPLDRRVDLFTLGVVLHEMLTLEPLFLGDGDLATIYKVMEMRIPKPSAVKRGVPAALDRIVMHALERDRERRYQTADEMGRDLDAFVTSALLSHEELVSFLAAL